MAEVRLEQFVLVEFWHWPTRLDAAVAQYFETRWHRVRIIESGAAGPGIICDDIYTCELYCYARDCAEQFGKEAVLCQLEDVQLLMEVVTSRMGQAKLKNDFQRIHIVLPLEDEANCVPQ